MSAEDRAAVGIGDDLVRVAVGLEAVDDVQADLQQALTGGGVDLQANDSR